MIDNALMAELKALLASGQKIEAIRVFREKTGVGLAEAKSAIEAIADGHSLSGSAPPSEPEDLTGIVLEAHRISRIEAIKRVRARTGMGLKEAKDLVDRIAVENGLETPRGAGCFGMLLMLTGVLGLMLGWTMAWS